MSGPAPKIADYLVMRLFENAPRPDAKPKLTATTLILDTITAFPHASLEEYLHGIAIAKQLIRWRGNARQDEQLAAIAAAIRNLIRP